MKTKQAYPLMKKHFTFSTGEHIEADLEDLQRLLQEN